MSTGIAPAEVTSKQARIGTFAILERLNHSDAPSGQVTLRVAGLPGSRHDGVSGIATCLPAPKSDDATARIQILLDTLKSVDDVALCPVIEAEIAGSIVYWVRANQVGEPLDSITGQLPIRDLGKMTVRIARAISVAARSGLTHGSINQTVILRNPDDGWKLTGLGILGRGEAQDQLDLALVIIARLASRPWSEPDLSGYPSEERPYHRSQRLREHLNTHTERVANVLTRATNPDPSMRYEDIAGFAEDFAKQIQLSADDLVHGAFEAISARNVELARIMGDKAAGYDPDLENLSILRLQLNGGSVFGNQQGATPLPVMPQFEMPAQPGRAVIPGLDGTVAPASAPASFQAFSSLPPELTQGLPPEFLQALAPQFEAKPVKKGMNPMFILLLGGLGVVLLLLIATMLTFFASGS